MNKKKIILFFVSIFFLVFLFGGSYFIWTALVQPDAVPSSKKPVDFETKLQTASLGFIDIISRQTKGYKPLFYHWLLIEKIARLPKEAGHWNMESVECSVNICTLKWTNKGIAIPKVLEDAFTEHGYQSLIKNLEFNRQGTESTLPNFRIDTDDNPIVSYKIFQSPSSSSFQERLRVTETETQIRQSNRSNELIVISNIRDTILQTEQAFNTLFPGVLTIQEPQSYSPEYAKQVLPRNLREMFFGTWSYEAKLEEIEFYIGLLDTLMENTLVANKISFNLTNDLIKYEGNYVYRQE